MSAPPRPKILRPKKMSPSSSILFHYTYIQLDFLLLFGRFCGRAQSNSSTTLYEWLRLHNPDGSDKRDQSPAAYNTHTHQQLRWALCLWLFRTFFLVELFLLSRRATSSFGRCQKSPQKISSEMTLTMLVFLKRNHKIERIRLKMSIIKFR